MSRSQLLPFTFRIPERDRRILKAYAELTMRTQTSLLLEWIRSLEELLPANKRPAPELEGER